ncbi:AraC family transcriptional regulator ligand-binding domain-containing protein [Tropicimonas sp. TH_r6]|uniref:AraC family transcriptional regulator n=1 Tax=Tropicimonas sp. TH_r6 TaxID=3082085 RepID=UPI002955CDCF|nr:AraC family transcriptional regulator ligand-binding domain-containing protein [Tropicimonas sp. TH_r6]MDV7145570.1 AraC family transcriptional regulator ligand-binding domain-containing protein [Tropicimonas sp. TH_r6]
MAGPFPPPSRQTDLLHNPVRAKQMIEHLRRQGHPVVWLLRKAGLCPKELEQDTPSVPFRMVVTLWEEAARLTGDDFFGLHFGTMEKPSVATPLFYFVRSAETVLQLSEMLTRFGQVLGAGVEYYPERLETHGELAWRIHVPPETTGRQTVEHSVADILTGLRVASGQRIHPRKVLLQSPSPRKTSELQRVLGCPIEFNAPHNAIRLRPSTLDLPLLTADPHLKALMAGHCEAILSKTQAISLSRQVEIHVLKHSGVCWPRQVDVARHFGMSCRSFVRRLSDEGTRFRELSAKLREDLALSLVRETDQQMAQIAGRLGYSDSSAFSAAFRRWHGQSPRQMRAIARKSA